MFSLPYAELYKYKLRNKTNDADIEVILKNIKMNILSFCIAFFYDFM